ncbi:MAG: hypothetical protein A2Y15_02285 [Clostridiales bacterium GWF2_36_10]|nr:MAG: hypothetical protein A2Y15_02285 [Clostridiales bacterium GWF2_36_10]
MESTGTDKFFENIIRKEKPDIIHIWGTEFAHSYDMVKAAAKFGMKNKIIISIQGLVSVYTKHYCAFLPDKVCRSYSFKDKVKSRSIYKEQKSFENRGINEIKAIRGVDYVIGRTDWDYACTKQMNSDVNYFFCNETLRDSFYKQEWNLNNCKRHSIFLSQSSYPIKGFHLALEAFITVLQQYPDAHLYTTGSDIFTIPFWRLTSYQKHLSKIIIENDIKTKVSFLGNLSEQEMCDQYKKSHVFVSASSIENSPNSIGEAMLLGVPVISSDVGGVKNLMEHEKEGFIYQADAPYMLAFYINKIFSDDELVLKFSKNEKEHARFTHDRKVNLDNLINIYTIVLN